MPILDKVFDNTVACSLTELLILCLLALALVLNLMMDQFSQYIITMMDIWMAWVNSSASSMTLKTICLWTDWWWRYECLPGWWCQNQTPFYYSLGWGLPSSSYTHHWVLCDKDRGEVSLCVQKDQWCIHTLGFVLMNQFTDKDPQVVPIPA